MTREEIRTALPMLDDAAVDAVVGSGVSVPLLGSVVAALRQHGYLMPTAAAEHADAARRTVTAVVGLVNAFEGRDPFSGVAPAPAVRESLLAALPPPAAVSVPPVCVVHEVYQYTVAELVGPLPHRRRPPADAHVTIVVVDVEDFWAGLLETVWRRLTDVGSIDIVGQGPDIAWLCSVITQRLAAWWCTEDEAKAITGG